MQKGKIEELQERIKELEYQLDLKENENKKFTKSFIANISHEIRTPLNAIIGFSGLLKSRTLSNSKKEQFLTHINNSTERLLNLIDNIIELSYIQSDKMDLKLEKCNLTEILKSAYYYVNHLKEKHKKHTLTILYDESPIYGYDEFYTDEFRVLLVLRNLLSNSLKYTEQGFIEFGCNQKDDFLEFYVKDTGKGIRSMNQAIFESFNKNEDNHLIGSQGLGIGLSVCKGIINSMGGKIWFADNNPYGTAFYFTIPYVRSKTASNRELENTIYVS